LIDESLVGQIIQSKRLIVDKGTWARAEVAAAVIAASVAATVSTAIDAIVVQDTLHRNSCLQRSQ
jgi:hypothetical protein